MSRRGVMRRPKFTLHRLCQWTRKRPTGPTWKIIKRQERKDDDRERRRIKVFHSKGNFRWKIYCSTLFLLELCRRRCRLGGGGRLGRNTTSDGIIYVHKMDLMLENFWRRAHGIAMVGINRKHIVAVLVRKIIHLSILFSMESVTQRRWACTEFDGRHIGVVVGANKIENRSRRIRTLCVCVRLKSW